MLHQKLLGGCVKETPLFFNWIIAIIVLCNFLKKDFISIITSIISKLEEQVKMI